MTLRGKLLVSIVTNLVLIASLLAFNSMMARQEEEHVRRLLRVHHQYTTLLDLKIAVNRHLTEAQAIFIYGKKADPGGFIQAAGEAAGRFDALDKLLAADGRDWLRRVREEYNLVHRELQLMTRLIALGRQAKAREHFSSVVAGRFNDIFAAIDRRIDTERRLLRQIETSYIRVNRRGNTVSIVALAAIFTVICVVSFLFFHAFGPRLRELMRGTERIAAGDLRTPVPVSGRDEFARLASAMNRMREELAASRRTLLEQSYYSGMADMVAGALHNVRNSLAPVNASLAEAGDRLGELTGSNAMAAAKEISACVEAPERLRALGEYVCLYCERLDEELPAIGRHIDAARAKIRTVEKVLQQQGRFAVAGRPMEEVAVEALVADALNLVRPGRVDIVVESGMPDVAVRTQPIVMAQVLANLVNNAVESIERAGVEPGRVWLSASLERRDGGSMLHIEVGDNGAGIEDDMLETIFRRGVSSKDTPSGLGLHWCANAVGALGGRIHAESAGPGQGAVFHVRLPAIA